MTSPNHKRLTRAVIAFDYRAKTSLAVEITHFATTLSRPEFLGVLIEDIELLEHSRSSLAREVLYSGAARPLESAALSRQLRARSKEARTEFEQTADRLGLAHAFRSFHGKALAEIAEWAEGTDSSLVTLAADSIIEGIAQHAALHELLGTSVQTLLFARAGWRTGVSILALVDDLDTAAANLAIAARLAEASRSPLFVKLEAKESSDTAAAEKLISDLTSAVSVPVQVAAGTGNIDADAIASTIRQTRARIVILPWHLATAEPGLIARLIKATNAAIALVK
jgi:hypothetical protein